VQFTATDSHLLVYADALEHTSHTKYVRDSYSVLSSAVMRCVLIRQSIKGNAGPIASVLERFYNIQCTANQ